MTKAPGDNTTPPRRRARERIIPSGQLPPEWVPLADAPWWIERIYGVSGDHIKRDLILAARGGLLRRGVATPILRVFGTYAEAAADAEPDPPHSPVIKIITGVRRSTDAGALKARRPSTSCSDQITEIGARDTIGGADWERGIQITDKDLTIMVFWASVGVYAERRLPQWREPAPAPAEAKPPFDARKAMALLMAKKDSGDWPEAPNEDVTRAFLLQTFGGVSNDPHREIRREVWPDMRRGRRTKRRHGGLAGKKP